MTESRQALIWLLALAAFGLAVHLLAPILLPFVAGFGIAYLLDPLVDRLEQAGLGRTWGTAVILSGFLLVLLIALAVLVPLIQDQIAGLASRAPEILNALERHAQSVVARLSTELSAEDMESLKSAAGGLVGNAFKMAGQVLGSLWSGGLALVNLLSLIFITPVVAFYLMRDWPLIIARVDSWLPREHAATIRTLTGEANEMIAGFVRGAGMVCLILAIFYGTSLTLVGLEFGLVIGLISGFISFIPFVGAAVGFVASVGVAIAQFGEWGPVLLTAGIFVVGQVAEGNFLTPKLVGDRIRLHPVWVIFALLAAGLLFGFVGVLLAVPVAAVIGVLVRFAVGRYKESALYLGPEEDEGEDGGGFS